MRNRPSALVTGATLGIGAEISRELAKKGFDLVLVARGKDRLDQFAGEMSDRYGAKCEAIVADLEDQAALSMVVRRVTDGAPIDTVVNNAGFGSYGRFSDLPVDSQMGQVRLNVLALVALSHAALSTMVPRGSGRLLNVGSLAGFQTGPYSATYAATKAFVLSFTEALHEEVRGSGVQVTVLCPGFTLTEFQTRAKVNLKGVPGLLWTDAHFVAASGLAALERNEAVSVPGTINALSSMAARLAPRSVVRRMSATVTRRLS
jgi:short-subunit dehydrogenase